MESSLLGDTIEGAAAFALKERAEASTSIAQAAAIFSDAFLCGMPEAAKHALSVLQGLSVDAAALAEVAATAEQLSLVVRYGDLRQFDAASVVPLLEQLYLRSWGVNAQQAAEILMNDLTEIEQEVLSGLDEFDFDDI